MQTIEKFLSCDWGTSNFRLRLIEACTISTLAEQTAPQGISATYNLWQQSGQNRQGFYLDVIQQHIKQLEEKLKVSLAGLPVVLSGMASSSIGMKELPYTSVPFFADGRDLNSELIAPGDNFPHDLLIISGAKTGNDVMRGEETQLAGIFYNTANSVFVLPGTHSKHITVQDGKVTDITTYMTGEFFELLSKKSILAASLEDTGDINEPQNHNSFAEGIADSVTANLLHQCFMLRTNLLLNKTSKQQNYFYLSGLLLGTELKSLLQTMPPHITLAASGKVQQYYQTAFDILLPPGHTTTLAVENADDAVIKGQLRILCEKKC